MKSVFEYTLGKKAEDTTSGILHFLMEKGSDHMFQKISEYFQFEVNSKEQITISEQTANEFGRFDLHIAAKDESFEYIIENKLSASFTWNKDGIHQVERYINYLGQSGNRRNKLYILCPAQRTPHIEREVEAYSIENVQISIIEWEGLCELLKQFDNPVGKELVTFINSRYLVNARLSEEGVKMFSDCNYGIDFIRMMQIIDKIHSSLDLDKKKAPKFDKDDYSYGFFFTYGKNEYWFGFLPDIWASHGVPIALQHRSLTKENAHFKSYKNFEGEELYKFFHAFENFSDSGAIINHLGTLIET